MPTTPDVKTVDQLQNHEDLNIQKTAKEIQELKDADKNNDSIELNWVLTTEFANTLKANPDIAKTLFEAIPKAVAWEDKGITDLRNFLEPIANPQVIEWSIAANETAEWEAQSVLDKFGDFFWEAGALKDIQNVDWLSTETKKAVAEIKKALEHPNIKNIQNLQDFLYKNTKDTDKASFFTKNRKDKNQATYDEKKWTDNWDGKIWKCDKKGDEFVWSTANALNKFLKDTVDYIWKLKTHQNIAETWDAELKNKEFDDIKADITNLNTNGKYADVKAKYDAAKAKYDELKKKYWDDFDITNELSKKLANIEKELPKLERKERREQASSTLLSFEKLSNQLKALNNPEINGILTQQLTPLNEQLKKWDSLKKLKEEMARLQWEIDSYDKNGDGLLDQTDKRWNRDKINELEKKKKEIDNQITAKTWIINKIKTELSKIQTILREEDNKSIAETFYWLWEWETINDTMDWDKEKDWTPLKQYENNLKNIWEDQPDEEPESDVDAVPEATTTTATPSSVDTKKKTSWPITFKELLDRLSNFEWKSWWWFWWFINNLINFFSELAWWTGNIDKFKGKDNIEFDNETVKAVLSLVQRTHNVNWIEQIKKTLEDGTEEKIRELQMALWTPTNNLMITGKIDEQTAKILKSYIENKDNAWTQKDLWFECLKWFTTNNKPISVSDKVGWYIYTKTNSYGKTETALKWTINWKSCVALNITHEEKTGESWWKQHTITADHDAIIQYSDWTKEVWKFDGDLKLIEWTRYSGGKEEKVTATTNPEATGTTTGNPTTTDHPETTSTTVPQQQNQPSQQQNPQPQWATAPTQPGTQQWA